MNDETPDAGTEARIGAKDPGDRPTSSEAAAADRAEDGQPDVADSYRDMTERGAATGGEGKID